MTEKLDNVNLENRVKSFLDNVKNNVRTELSDIFDEETEKPLYMKNSSSVSSKFGRTIIDADGDLDSNLNRGDIIMNLQSSGRDRKPKDRTRSKKSRKTNKTESGQRSEEKDCDISECSSTNDAKTKICSENSCATTDEKCLGTSETEINYIEEIEKEIQYILDECAKSNSMQKSDDNFEMTDNSNPQIGADLDPEKNEINNISILNTENILNNQTVPIDLNINSIFEGIMSASKEEQQAKIDHLREILNTHKEFEEIIKLGPSDKLYIAPVQETKKNVDGSEEHITVNRLKVHVGGTSYVSAAWRTWNGQNREDILAHIKQTIENLEKQTAYKSTLSTGPFVPQYVKKIHEAADKLESHILSQYTNHQETIESYAKRMRDAANKISAIHEKRTVA